MADALLVEQRGHVLVLTINRPEARNAINGAVAEAMVAALDQLDADPDLRVAVLTGAGGAFSSGMDLKSFLAGETPAIPGRGLAGMTQVPPPKPMVAAVEGWAVAGGFELVLACDLVVAGKSARFGLPEVKRSLVASGGGALLLPERIPRAVAVEMLLTGDPITAVRAAEVGLVNEVVADGGAVDRAVEIATSIAANGPLAVQAIREIIRQSPDWSMSERWERQRVLSDPVFASEDAREGAAAFVEKRAPRWQGR